MWQLITDAGAWDDALRKLPSPHVLQSWAWGAFKSRWGWTAERWLLTDAQAQSRAAVQLLKRSISKLPACVLYAPKGPASADLAAHAEALALIEQRAKHHRALWAKADGDILPPPPAPPPSAGEGKELRTLLEQRKWLPSASQIQFRNTMLTLLQRDDAALLAAMKPKCRYNIRLAEKRGVTVRTLSPINDDDAGLLYAMYDETSKRDGFLIREEAYYRDAWKAMKAVGFVAEHEGEPLGGIVLLCFADRAWYFYGMSRSVGREHMPNHLLQWTAMRWARDAGHVLYDWWGAPEKLDESDGMWGVYRFKESFGAEFFEGIGAWDFAPSALLYRAYVELGPKLIRSGIAG
jgi:lipid II:glycine glycyltransferase (peptidoglycan interpeptide bridge formation enzyme)